MMKMPRMMGSKLLPLCLLALASCAQHNAARIVQDEPLEPSGLTWAEEWDLFSKRETMPWIASKEVAEHLDAFRKQGFDDAILSGCVPFVVCDIDNLESDDLFFARPAAAYFDANCYRFFVVSSTNGSLYGSISVIVKKSIVWNPFTMKVEREEKTKQWIEISFMPIETGMLLSRIMLAKYGFPFDAYQCSVPYANAMFVIIHRENDTIAVAVNTVSDLDIRRGQELSLTEVRRRTVEYLKKKKVAL